ncbi:cbb3-type cytochrome oxidase assembly protein CcoS [Thauera sp.]|jgi:cbb3-type cytochrome oxidase maturation protein|uniref:cbb3-type cytochrome oxidase assembly protein CcoS n=1 Tax=Thauera sp. TaxID=1905334 RepID=UPI001B612B79|nr:cbb3-type cytochrome oxidase assembly protein CcoS [Thauera sp.]MBP6131828.1 cbb3-type cytochrome oxidase assembly protein CcoS [Thauera sp.]MBP7047898.1 cbb3-type cytochrome oxidase assembly protein CcoS [Thauera sp.]
MESLYLLIPLSVVLVFVIGVLFWWSLRSGQYDDLEGPAYRLLMDDREQLPGDGQERDADPSGEVAANGASDRRTGSAGEQSRFR